MKIIQHINNIVVDIINVRDDVTTGNIAIVNEIPTLEHIEGYNGVLKYDNEKGLYWDYEPALVIDEISSEELKEMVEEVL